MFIYIKTFLHHWIINAENATSFSRNFGLSTDFWAFFGWKDLMFYVFFWRSTCTGKEKVSLRVNSDESTTKKSHDRKWKKILSKPRGISLITKKKKLKHFRSLHKFSLHKLILVIHSWRILLVLSDLTAVVYIETNLFFIMMKRYKTVSRIISMWLNLVCCYCGDWPTILSVKIELVH